jgi:hypothetical protein
MPNEVFQELQSRAGVLLAAVKTSALASKALWERLSYKEQNDLLEDLRQRALLVRDWVNGPKFLAKVREIGFAYDPAAYDHERDGFVEGEWPPGGSGPCRPPCGFTTP